jgi:hypothetical protein
MNTLKFEDDRMCMHHIEDMSWKEYRNKFVDEYVCEIMELNKFVTLKSIMNYMLLLKVVKDVNVIVMLDKPICKSATSRLNGCMAFNTHWSMNPPLVAQAFMNMCTHAYMTKYKNADKETVMNNFKDMIEFSGLLAFDGKFFIAAVPGYSTNAWADLKSMVSTAMTLVCLITSRSLTKSKLKVYVMGQKASQVMNMVKAQAKHKFPSEVKVMKMSDPSFLYRISPASMITKSKMYKVMSVNEDLHVAMNDIMIKHKLTDMNENRAAYENMNVTILMPTNELMNYFMLGLGLGLLK